ncbi:MAG: hypothetical protein IT223_06665 [Crocinitomicaceae bacterium]|nr:hypothetical protein [Crocinitomicaceae bacterium]
MAVLQQKYSLAAALTLSLFLGLMSFTNPDKGPMNWDVTGYYFYLPGLFIHHDVALQDIQKMEDLRIKYDLSGTLYQFHPVEGRSNFVDQYPLGMAVLYSPTFFAGHFFAGLLSYEKDGFSPPYQWAMIIWSFLVAIAGIFALRSLLMHFFSDGISALALILILAGSNYFIQVSRGLTTPHNYLFTLYALFLLAVIRWHKQPAYRTTALMIAPLGLACLARPTEMVAIVIPVLWGCNSTSEIRQRIKILFSKQRSFTLFAIALLMLIALPQFIYWKMTTGHWLYMSYSNPAEGLDFLSPHTINFLFSFRKGWFIYTPLMLISLTGFFFLYKKKKNIFWPLIVFFILNLYVLSSWSCWWYAQCFSQRAMVQSLPVMALLMGFTLSWISEKKWYAITGGVLISLAFLQTLFFQWQYEHRILDQWRMTSEYFWAVFGKTSVTDKDKELLLIDRPFDGSMIFENKDRYKETLFFSFAHLMPEVLKDKSPGDSTSFPGQKLSKDVEFTLPIKKRFRDITDKDHVWIEASAEVWLSDSASAEDLLLVCTGDHKGGLYGYRTAGVPPDSLKRNAWNTIRIDYLTPEMRTKKDFVSFYLWYRGQDSAFVKDFSIRVFERENQQ